MKKLCFTIFIFGRKYQAFLPLYLYSVFSTYNSKEYEVVIYLSGKLSKRIRKNIVDNIGVKSYVIRENYFKRFNRNKYSSQVKKSLRWLINDEYFKEFNSVYTGDVDIFICKEKLSLYEQHMGHAKQYEIPYSNVVRKKTMKRKLNFKQIVITYLNTGFRGVYHYFKAKSITVSRLSGLHFVIEEEYYKKVSSIQNEYLNKIMSKKTRFKYFRHHPTGFHNESLLFDLVKEANIKIYQDNKPLTIEPENYEQINFRPHHGIHLGIFRSKETMNAEEKVISSNLYKQYYLQFSEKRKADSNLMSILNHSTKYIKTIIRNMDQFYSNFISDHQQEN